MTDEQAGQVNLRRAELLCVVIPCFNEQGNIVPLAEAIRQNTEAMECRVEIILVDDGSSDESWHEIESLVADQAAVMGLKLSRNFGKEAAIAAGLSKADGDIVILMDADLQHPPDQIPLLVERWRQGDVEIVEAVKQNRGAESQWKTLASTAFYAIFSKLADLDIKDASDYKLLSRKAIEAWKQLPERNLFFRGMSMWIGFPRAEIYYSVAGRIHGESKWGLLKLTKLALTAVTSYSSAPLRLVGLSGILFGVFALVLSIQTLFNYFSGQAVSGFTTVIILLALVGAVILFGLTIIGEYIARIYDEIKARPRYLIEKTTVDE